MLNITSQWQDPETVIFVIRVYYEKLGHMLKPIVPKFRSDLSVHFKDIAEKQVPAELKPIVVDLCKGDNLLVTLGMGSK